ncbi:cell division protein FtsB [Dyella nitratireducens]|uniref:Cell division protein FtsB n=1 Tax=Dyella nitratireducens TaxID=1849580 RepID=A0ABQ1GHA0_9GAMM|nr:cell division protein FtsB [Dyella nitratireducens]GGA43673.1 cell division protein FtsB [Dyella nitratireducens]GLQ41844.1 cell division protein FtsB [Dyella nitratireducens]
MLRWVALILLLILIGLQFELWSSHGGMSEVTNLHAAVQKQQDENDKLTQRNQALAADVDDLKHGEQAVEARARGELGLIKPGETFYQVVPKPAASTDAPAASGTSGGH